MGPIKPGDRFFAVEEKIHNRVMTTHVTVTKTGRRWVSFKRDGSTHERKEDRFDRETFRIDGAGFTSPGRVYPSEEAYREAKHAEAIWREFSRAVDRQYGVPEGKTKIDILKAADALGFRLKEE